MLELADVFRRYGAEYRARFQDRMPPAHLRAMRDSEDCRSERLGGQVYLCEPCQQLQYSYHSCQNRHCPKCQHEAAQDWLQQQRQCLLPVLYFLVTFTLPQELHALAGSHPKVLYHLLVQTSAAALQKLAGDPRPLGGQIARMGVLQPWARALSSHPPVHYMVPGGGLSPDSRQGLPAGQKFFLPVLALSLIFRAKFRAALKKAGRFDAVPPQVWKKDWGVPCQPVGPGEQVLKYLAPYLYRIALSHGRLVSREKHQVTFRYKDAESGQWRPMTLNALEFSRRFLQPVWPHGLVKVRYYGFLSPRHRLTLQTLRQILGVQSTSAAGPDPASRGNDRTEASGQSGGPRCPRCGQVMRRLETLLPAQRAPPGAIRFSAHRG